MAKLTVLDGPLEDQTFRLGDVTVVGRDPKWDIVIPHMTVSRKHALVVKAGDGYKIQDLGSINGTFVDGVRVGEETVEDGAKIKIGACIFRFDLSGDKQDDESHESAHEIRELESKVTPDLVIDCSTDPLVSALAEADAPDRVQAIQRLEAQLEDHQKKLAASGSLDGLLAAILEGALALAPDAQRGFIVLGDDEGRLSVHASRDREGREVEAVPHPPVDSMKVIAGLRAVAGTDDRGRRVAFVPLAAGDEVEGVIRIDREDSASAFDADTLVALGSLGRAAGPLVRFAKTQKTAEDTHARNIDSLMTAFGGMVGEAGRLAAETARADINHENVCFSTVMSLVRAMESKDEYTRGHSVRVTDYSLAIAEELNKRLPPSHGINLRRLRYAALLHDVGKINVREDVLNKPSGLTDDEMHHVRQHPEYTKYILDGLYLTHGLEGLDDIAACHHERYDGKGYPRQREQDSVPTESFILGVADTFDALTSDRPYRKRLPAEDAIRILEEGSGTQFSPEVVRVFVDLHRSGRIGKIQAQHAQIEEAPTVMDWGPSSSASAAGSFKVEP